MGPIRAIKTGLSNVFIFSGRASRSEYWWLFSFSLVLGTGFQNFASRATGVNSLPHQFDVDESEPLTLIFFSIYELSILLFCILMLSCAARRFQDHGWSGNWFKWMMYMCGAGLATILIYAGISVIATKPMLSCTPPWSMFLVFVPAASIIWTFWIGFVRPDPDSNKYGPNPHEVTP